MLHHVFIFGVVIPTIVTVACFIGFLICLFRSRLQRHLQKQSNDKPSQPHPDIDANYTENLCSSCRRQAFQNPSLGGAAARHFARVPVVPLPNKSGWISTGLRGYADYAEPDACYVVTEFGTRTNSAESSSHSRFECEFDDVTSHVTKTSITFDSTGSDVRRDSRSHDGNDRSRAVDESAETPNFDDKYQYFIRDIDSGKPICGEGSRYHEARTGCDIQRDVTLHSVKLMSTERRPDTCYVVVEPTSRTDFRCSPLAQRCDVIRSRNKEIQDARPITSHDKVDDINNDVNRYELNRPFETTSLSMSSRRRSSEKILTVLMTEFPLGERKHIGKLKTTSVGIPKSPDDVTDGVTDDVTDVVNVVELAKDDGITEGQERNYMTLIPRNNYVDVADVHVCPRNPSCSSSQRLVVKYRN